MNSPLIIILIVIIGIILIWLATGYNSLLSGKIKVEEAESGIDVALTKRFDVLTQMIVIVKGYVKQEDKTLEKIIDSHSVNIRQSSIEEKQEITQLMDQAMRAIHVFVEQYPDLKTNDDLIQLQLAISDVEEHLQAARRVYNANVSSYNQKVQVFPSKLLASLFHYSTKEFFEADDFKRNELEIKF
jgi:LemA protein